MDKISDEIRNFVERSYKDEYMDPKELLALADRIDAEMVKLPRDKDWKPIHCGDTVFLDDGREAEVKAIQFYDDGSATITCKMVDDFSFTRHTSSSLTHTRPDSLERLADELDEWFKDAAENRRIRPSDADALLDFSERIKKLANDKQDDE